MADFPLYDGSVFEAIGVDLTDSKGTLLTAGGTAHTKGSWVQLSASAPEGITGFFVQFYNPDYASADSRISVDIGIGSPETVIVPDLRHLTRVGFGGNTYFIPLHIPGGVSVSARMQAGTGISRTMDVALGVYRGCFLSSSPMTQATHYGFNSASTTGTAVDPGAAANTKGAAAEITASCTNPIRSMMILIGNGTVGNPPTRYSTSGYLVDIGIGATPDYILTNIPLVARGIDDCIWPAVIGPFDCCIPAGTRIVARAQSNETGSERAFDLSIIGFN